MQYFKQKNIVCACKRKISYRRSRSNKCTFCLFLWNFCKICFANLHISKIISNFAAKIENGSYDRFTIECRDIS